MGKIEPEDVKHPKLYVLVRGFGGFNFMFFLYLLLGFLAVLPNTYYGNPARPTLSTFLADGDIQFCIGLWLVWYLAYRFLLKKTLY